MSRHLVLEIGTEEIPAGYLPPALVQLKELAEKELAAQRIGHGEIRTYATPRRIVLSVQKVAEKQDVLTREVMGPAAAVAFDAEGKPTKAAEGFARGQGIGVSDLKVVDTPKGKYVAAVKSEASLPTEQILPSIMPRLITSLSFPKMQRWGSLSLRFPRPIRWILCLYGAKVVPFDLEGIASGRKTRGHRFLAPGPFAVKEAGDYFAVVKKGMIVLDQEKRREIIRAGVAKAAAEVKGRPVEDEGLVNEVAFLVEYPVVLRGTIAEKYLELPREVLITSMRSHQRYFSVMDRRGKLLPSFITVSNNRPRSRKVVIAGNERVLKARLEDAMFFWHEDRKVPLQKRAEELKTVVFQEKLGTSYEKYERFAALAEKVARKVAPDALAEVAKVALLCKADLCSQMVGEFAELQGVMGREYALQEGIDPTVAKGIMEHYLPKASGGETPTTAGGALVGMADRMDTVAGCFGIGITPTGTADPYGMRRHALAIIAILLDKGWRVSLTEIMRASLDLLRGKIDRDPGQTLAALCEFFKGRLQNQLASRGYRHDLISAVIDEYWDDPVDAVARVEALARFSRQAGFADLMVSFKRVMNIIPAGFSGRPDAALAKERAEKELLESAERVGAEAAALALKGDYAAALAGMARLKGPVDAFFAGVMVMDKDETVRQNRLAILASVSALFARVADFRKVVTE